MELHIPFDSSSETSVTKINNFRKEMLDMQRNMIRVSVRGGDGRISENMLKNVLRDTADGCVCENEGRYGNSCPYTAHHEYPSLAMVYAPYQRWHKLYDIESALSCGTLFQELNKPFEGGRGNGKGGKCCGM